MAHISAICVGDELLDGRITDRNASWLARWLGDRGLALGGVRMVSDDLDAIGEALEQVARRADLVVVCGGLGPTADDRTREAAARWAGRELELDEAVLERLERRFAEYGAPFTPNNRDQCAFPSGARILTSEVGTADGFVLDHAQTQVVFLPGVPSEFRWFVDTYIDDKLAEPAGAPARETLTFFGPGESQLETKLSGIEEFADELGARVGYRASYPTIEVELKAGDADSLEPLREFVTDRIGAWLIADGQRSFAERVGQALLDAGATATTAESCTAGRVAAKLTEVSGSSGWFERGYITYANAAKIEMLGVDAGILERFGAVSAQTVCQMALGARRLAGSTFALAISGIAGPTGGTPDKPVGTVHFALAGPEGVWHRRATFANRGRQRVLSASVYTILSLLLWRLEDRLDSHQINGPFSAEQVFSAAGVDINHDRDH
jgi:nicotinamide-nucleotide amidase